jgi:Nuclease-related domain/UvrD-like helicase C-terminal domain/AAA domain
MAKVYPEHWPETAPSQAERLLYEQFRAQLPDNYTVIQGVSWVQRDSRYHDQDGEIDFLIIHPRRGLLILEVKGGQISCQFGRWYSRDRGGVEHELKESPFAQATRHKHALFRKLEATAATSNYAALYQAHARIAVAFPDTLVGATNLGLFAEATNIIDSRDLNNIETALSRGMGHEDRDYSLPNAAIKALVDTLAPSFTLPAIGLAAEILGEKAAIRQLTEQQFHTLHMLRQVPQAAIGGCAGSGKTMLAMEKARRLVREGARVLFVCYNRPLADYVNERFAADPDTSGKVLTLNYTMLVRELCRRAAIKLPAESKMAPDQMQQYYDIEMPSYMEQATAALPEVRFDAIIVDEGQDFLDFWLDTLRKLLADDSGVFYIFYDSNQRIYGDNRATLSQWDGPRFSLDLNCRNTRRINALVMRYYQGDDPPEAGGPDGREPLIVPVAAGSEKELLRRTLNELVNTQGLPLSDIVVLTPLGEARSVCKEGDKLGNISLTWKRKAGPGQVRLSTIHKFKGLEAPIVILIEPDKAHEGAVREYLMYVALSRATSQLIVLGELPKPQKEAAAVGAEAILEGMGDEQ